MNHLLVTNDFPPKVGGIQSYLWELWRRLPADEFAVLTTPHESAEAFDAAQPFRIERIDAPVMLPVPSMVRRIDALAGELGARRVLLDPALPIGAVGPQLGRPYGVVVHGAEVAVYGRLPGSRQVMGRVLRGAEIVISAGGYPAAEAERAAGARLPISLVPPGVDTDRFTPPTDEQVAEIRARYAVAPDAPLVVGFSRLVPRKGMDVLIEAASLAAAQAPGLRLLIGGKGRDRARLERLIERHRAPADLIGFVPDDDLPVLLGAADVVAMLCRTRWAGLEQEGFGIVFVEAAAAGTAQVAGRSGGAHEAVADGETGLVVDRPQSADAVAHALLALLGDAERLRAMGLASRQRAVASFSYDVLAARLADALGIDRASR